MTQQLSADFVVIGSGIIGSLAARKLAQAGASVLILEAGPRVTRDEVVARFRNSNAPQRLDVAVSVDALGAAPDLPAEG